MLIQHYKNNTLINTCTILTMESLEHVGGGGGGASWCLAARGSLLVAARRSVWPSRLCVSYGQICKNNHENV